MRNLLANKEKNNIRNLCRFLGKLLGTSFSSELHFPGKGSSRSPQGGKERALSDCRPHALPQSACGSSSGTQLVGRCSSDSWDSHCPQVSLSFLILDKDNALLQACSSGQMTSPSVGDIVRNGHAGWQPGSPISQGCCPVHSDS